MELKTLKRGRPLKNNRNIENNGYPILISSFYAKTRI